MKLAILENYKAVGKLHGRGDSFESGKVKHHNFETIGQLYSLIKNIAQRPKLSVCIGNFPRDGEVVPKEKAQIGDMTRTKEVVNKGHIMVIDNDLGEAFDLAVFSKYWDIFEGAGHVVTKSGSTLSGKKKHGSHTYFIVEDGIRNLKSAMEFLEAICIVEGHFKVEIYKTGRPVIKTPVDLALTQSSRVVYEDDIEPELTRGGGIDITKFPKEYEKIMKRATKIAVRELEAVEPESHRIHKKYVKELTGVKLKGKKAIRESLDSYGEYNIDENFKLYSGGHCVGTVGDLILGKLDETYFADLYEPDYGGGSQKAIYFPESKTFFSQAHGGIKYNVVLSDEFNNQLVTEFLKEVPYLTDAYEMSDELLEIVKVRDIIEKKRLTREYAKDRGVTAVDVEKELKRLSVLRETFDKFYDLWLRGEYDKTVNPESRLENLIAYRKSSNMVNTGGKVVIVSTYTDDENNLITNMNPLDTENRMWSDRKTTVLNVNKTNGETVFTQMDTPTLFIEGHVGDDSGVIEPCKRWLGMEFSPNKQLDVAYNLFNGFAVSPRKGDITTWRETMLKVYGESHYEFMMDWFADMYQNPNRKCTFAVVVRGEKGCVPCDTEFLTPTGWKRIDEYVEGDMVCEWSPDGSTVFRKPKDYVKLPTDGFTNVKNMTMDMTLSEGHRVPYITSKGHHAVKSFSKIREMKNYTLPRTFKAPENCEGVNMNDDEIRLLIMQTADGTIAKNKIRVNVKKDRKKIRAVEILESLNIEYVRVDDVSGYTRFMFKPFVMKKDLSELWKADSRQMKVIFDEMIAWDGSIAERNGRETYRFSGNKRDNDLFQYVASCVTGKYVNISKDNREYVVEDIYETNVSNRVRNTVSQDDETTFVKSEDGFQYCFETETSFWLMRQKGRIYPTGNTGKNTFEEVLGRSLLSTENYFRTANKTQLFGKFNKALASNLLTVGQEIVWGGEHEYDSVLKDMITEKTRVLEVKGLDAFTINNFSRLYMTSNAEWVVPASSEERRFYVASTNKDVLTKAEWGKFYQWLKEDGVKEALMYEMVNRDLSDFNNIFCPITKELGEQKHESMFGVTRFVADAIENGYFGQYSTNNFGNVIDYEDYGVVLVCDLHSKYAEKNNVNKMSIQKFSRELTNLGITERTIHEKSKCIILPPRVKLAKFFKKTIGVTLNLT